MIEFKHPGLADELAAAPELLRQELYDFEAWSRENSIRPPCVTCIRREPDANATVGGVKTSLHLQGRAFDLRTIHYDVASLRLVNAYWQSRKRPGLEVITALHGNGPHVHVGLK